MVNESAVSISNNELLQSTATWSSTNLADFIRSLILKFYANGVRTGEVKIACADYDLGAIDWTTDGNVPKVNDVITVEGDPTYWRVTGRRFAHAGAPSIILELQEVIV